jgi:hypothetical protein
MGTKGILRGISLKLGQTKRAVGNLTTAAHYQCDRQTPLGNLGTFMQPFGLSPKAGGANERIEPSGKDLFIHPKMHG